MREKIPWWYPSVGAEEAQAILEVLDSGYLNDGEWTRRLERQIADLYGVKHAVAVTSGTAALFVALKACGVGTGDEVLVPAFSFIATANAVEMTGATPIFCDVSTEDFNVLPSEVEANLSHRTKAVIPVHVNGRRAPMEQLLMLAAEHSLFIIEDAAGAFGSRWNDRLLGTEGTFGCLSLAPTKIVTAGQGGIVLCHKDEHARRLQELKDQGRSAQGTGGADDHPVIGYNFKLTNLQASVALTQLRLLDSRRTFLSELREQYRVRLDNLQGIRLPALDIDAGAHCQWVDALCQERDRLADHLKEHGIGSREFWRPIPSQRCYHSDRSFPRAEAISRDGLWLPSNLDMNEAEVDHVVAAIRTFYSKTRTQ